MLNDTLDILLPLHHSNETTRNNEDRRLYAICCQFGQMAKHGLRPPAGLFRAPLAVFATALLAQSFPVILAPDP